MATSEERKAHNEGVFRSANEKLEQAARDVRALDTSLVTFLCECPNTDCTQVVLLTVVEYEKVRARGEQGLAAKGHEDPEIERVVETNDRFLVTEKVGRAGDVHRATDPRA